MRINAKPMAVACALGLAALPAIGIVSQPVHAQSITKDDVARLIRIAVMTEWVTQECDSSELEGMLLMTARSTLRVADAGDIERFRAAVRQRVAGFKTKQDACRSATDYLKSVQ